MKKIFIPQTLSISKSTLLYLLVWLSIGLFSACSSSYDRPKDPSFLDEVESSSASGGSSFDRSDKAAMEKAAIAAADAHVAAKKQEAMLQQQKKDLNTANSQPVDPEFFNRKIIKKGTLSFETKNLKEQYKQVKQVVGLVQGYIAGESFLEGYDRKEWQMTLKVPNEEFERAFDLLSKHAGEVEVKKITTKDVTEEFVDITARVKAQKTIEDRYFDLLTKAKDVEDMLKIERELGKIREKIESLEGRLRFLGNRVSLSTINLSFYKSIPPTAESGFFTKIKRGFKSGWDDVIQLLIDLSYIWPLLIFLGFIGWLVWKRWLSKPWPTKKKD